MAASAPMLRASSSSASVARPAVPWSGPSKTARPAMMADPTGAMVLTARVDAARSWSANSVSALSISRQ